MTLVMVQFTSEARLQGTVARVSLQHEADPWKALEALGRNGMTAKKSSFTVSMFWLCDPQPSLLLSLSSTYGVATCLPTVNAARPLLRLYPIQDLHFDSELLFF